MKVTPYGIGEPADECLFEVKHDSIAEITLKPSEGLHPLRLLPFPGFTSDEMIPGIQLTREGDVLTGRAWLRKGDCRAGDGLTGANGASPTRPMVRCKSGC